MLRSLSGDCSDKEFLYKRSGSQSTYLVEKKNIQNYLLFNVKSELHVKYMHHEPKIILNKQNQGENKKGEKSWKNESYP